MGRYLTRLTAVALASTALIFFDGRDASAQQVGTGAAVEGAVFVNRGTRLPVATGTDFFLEDRVLTEIESRLQILLLDQTTFTIGENADLVIDRFVYDPDRDAADLSADIARGAFRFVGGQRGGAAATIDTPAATIGIRGTFIEGVVGRDAQLLAEIAGIDPIVCGNPDNALFVALRGAGRGETSGGHLSGRVTVDSGRDRRTLSESNWALYVPDRDCPISEPAFYETAVRQALDESLRSSPSTAGTATGPIPLDPLQPGALPPSPPLPEVLAPIVGTGPDDFNVGVGGGAGGDDGGGGGVDPSGGTVDPSGGPINQN